MAHAACGTPARAQVVKSLRFGGVPVPRDYEARFQRVLWLFRHQRVFCPAAQACVHVRPLPPGGLGAADVDVPAALPRAHAPGAAPAGSSYGAGEGGGAGGGAGGEQEDPLWFLGPLLPPDVSAGIARGGARGRGGDEGGCAACAAAPRLPGAVRRSSLSACPAHAATHTGLLTARCV